MKIQKGIKFKMVNAFIFEKINKISVKVKKIESEKGIILKVQNGKSCKKDKKDHAR